MVPRNLQPVVEYTPVAAAHVDENLAMPYSAREHRPESSVVRVALVGVVEERAPPKSWPKRTSSAALRATRAARVSAAFIIDLARRLHR